MPNYTAIFSIVSYQQEKQFACHQAHFVFLYIAKFKT